MDMVASKNFTVVHELKCDREPFQLMMLGFKTAEYRKLDRPFLIGDYLELREYDKVNREFTGRELVAEITNVFPLDQYGPEGYGLISLKNIRETLDIDLEDREESTTYYQDDQIHGAELSVCPLCHEESKQIVNMNTHQRGCIPCLFGKPKQQPEVEHDEDGEPEDCPRCGIAHGEGTL
jgi:hypothetical protein